jgi:hypothetical protein
MIQELESTQQELWSGKTDIEFAIKKLFEFIKEFEIEDCLDFMTEDEIEKLINDGRIPLILDSMEKMVRIILDRSKGVYYIYKVDIFKKINKNYEFTGKKDDVKTNIGDLFLKQEN